MKWQSTPDRNVIASGPFYIRRCQGPNGVRYLLGKGPECLGGFDTPQEAKEAAEREAHREQ